MSAALKMARASDKDIDNAVRLVHILDALGATFGPFYPPNADGEHDEDAPRCFDPEDKQHLRYLYDQLAVISRRGGLMRVVFGMSTLLGNHVCDLEQDTLEWHPTLAMVAQAREPENLPGVVDAIARRLDPLAFDSAPGYRPRGLEGTLDDAVSGAMMISRQRRAQANARKALMALGVIPEEKPDAAYNPPPAPPANQPGDDAIMTGGES